MSPRRCVTIGMLLIALLAVPREGAAFFGWIHEMSGPRMIGLGYTCKPFSARLFRRSHEETEPTETEKSDDTETEKADDTETEELGRRTNRSPSFLGGSFSHDKCFGNKAGKSEVPNRAHFWVRYEGFLLASYEHEADPRGHTVGAISQGFMLEASPVHPHEAKGGRRGTVMFFGVGVEVFRFFGDHFKPFTVPRTNVCTILGWVGRRCRGRGSDVALVQGSPDSRPSGH